MIISNLSSSGGGEDRTEINVTISGNFSQEMKPNVLYKFTGNANSLTLSTAPGSSGKVNEYMWQIQPTGNVPDMTYPGDPEDITWENGAPPILENNKTYQFSMINNIIRVTPNSKGFIIKDSAPNNTSLLWIKPNGQMYFYSNVTSQWELVVPSWG